MSERGVFAVDRGIWGHPVFEDEPFTEREAWAWLISEAAFKPRGKRVGNTVFDLERGQIAVSLRFMADAWQWQHTRVRRFLTRLKTATMIEQQTQRDATVITICNYNKYQRVSLPDRTEDNTQNRTPIEHQQNKLEDTKNTEGRDKIVERASAFTESSKALASAFWKALGFESPLHIPPQFAGVDWRAIEWDRAGWTEDLIRAEAGRIGPDKPLSYYEKVFASSFAKRQAPLPIVAIREAETLTVTTHAKPKSAIIQAADDLCRKLASFDGPSGEVDELRSAAGQAPPRLLSHR